MNPNPSDQQLLEAFRCERCDEAFREIVRRYMPLVLGVCKRVLHEASDAEDAAQAAFVTLALKAKHLDARNGLAGWLHRVARAVSIDLLRRNQRRHSKHEAFAVATTQSGVDREFFDLDDAIQKLPPALRECVVEHYFMGHSIAQIADKTGISEAAATMRLSRARETLRRRLRTSAPALAAIISGCRMGAEASVPLVAEVARAARAVACGQAVGGGASEAVLLAMRLLRRWTLQRAAWVGSAGVAAALVVAPFASQLSARAEKPTVVAPVVEKVQVMPAAVAESVPKNSPALQVVHPLVKLIESREFGIDLDFARALAANRDDINSIRNAYGQGLLHIAASRAYENEALLLLKAGADPNLRDAAGKTPLHYAVVDDRDDRDVIRDMLILSGAQVGIEDNSGDTPLISALAGSAGPATIEFLLWLGESVQPGRAAPGHQPLALAAARNDAKILALVDAALKDLNVADAPAGKARTVPEYLHSSFTRAAELGDLAALEIMIGSGADINATDENGNTALVRAAARERFDVVVYLLLLGADPNRADAKGMSPLGATTYILGFGSDYCRLVLIAAGASPVHELKDGNSLLTFAASREQEHGMQWLIWRGVDPNAPARVGTPMHVATKAGNVRAEERLRRNGVTEAAYTSDVPEWRFATAVRRGEIEEIDAILSDGVPVDLPLENGANAMILAIHSRRINVARHLLQRGSNPNYQNPKNGSTPLHASTSWLYVEIEQFRRELLAAGADPNLPDKQGVTPFMTACRDGNLQPKVIQMLDAGGDLQKTDASGKNALVFAKNSDLPETYGFLTSLGTPERERMIDAASGTLIGGWENGSHRADFLPDGRIIIHENGRLEYEGKWKLEGDRIVITRNTKSGSSERRFLIVDISPERYRSMNLNEWGIAEYRRVPPGR